MVKRSLASQFAPVLLGSLTGAVLLGCANKGYSPLESPRDATAIQTGKPSSPEMVSLPQEPAPVVGLDNIDAGPPPVSRAGTNTGHTPPATAQFGRGWIPLRTWAERSGLSKPERIAAGSAVAFRIPTRNGWCKLTIGTRLAHWNGVAVWLGFAPQMIQGEPHINALDAEKTLTPLTEPVEKFSLPRRTIVLDPGHGGSDSGTRDAQNHFEKDFALDWALRTERLLTNAGWKVFLTRRTDVDVPLAERVSFADRVQADLFISLHFNSAFPQTAPSGIETYCLTPAGMPSTLVREFADDGRIIFPNNAWDAANMAWAHRIHRALLTQTAAHDDGVKRARFMGVLRYQNRPAVLVEGGFLSNAQDASDINSPAYRQSLAQALAQGLK